MEYFDRPTQVKFWDYDEHEWTYGIAYKNEIICGCCGGIFEVAEIVENCTFTPAIEKLPWISLRDEIRGT